MTDTPQASKSSVKRDRVLVVDDSRMVNRILVQHVTHELGLSAEVAVSLAQVKELLSSNPERFFISVLDLNLPDAPDGEVVDYVLDHHIPPIILTAGMEGEVRDKLMAKPIVDYVIKRNLNEIEYIGDTILRLYNNRKRTILLVDDSKTSRQLMSMLLKRHYFNILEAQDGIEALSILDQQSVDLVVTDFNMPKMNGDELTLKIREQYTRSELAIIGLSATGNAPVSVKLLKSGANDFITRPFMVEEFYCRINQNIDMTTTCKRLSDAANHDFLTELHNRKYAYEEGVKLVKNANKHNLTLMVAVLDVDHFKTINDTFGHNAGDIALKHIAGLIVDYAGEANIVARIGGEEFCIVSLAPPKDCDTLLNSIRITISEHPVVYNGRTIPLSISIGYTTTLTESLEQMMNAADAALYRAKSSGRDKVIGHYS